MDGHSGSDGDGAGRRGSVVTAHALLSSGPQLLDDRLALYRLAARLAGHRPDPSPAELDNPISRYRIGEFIAGRSPVGQLELARPADLVDDEVDCDLAIAGRPDAADLLAPALRSVAAEAGGAGGAPRALPPPARGRFPAG